MPGSRVTFIGDSMAAVVQGVAEVRTLIGQPPVVVGGLAVMCRLSSPYMAAAGPVAAYHLGRQAGVDSGLNTGTDEGDDQ